MMQQRDRWGPAIAGCLLLGLALGTVQTMAFFVPSHHRPVPTMHSLPVSDSDPPAPVVGDADYEAFLLQCKALCEQRNLPLAKVKNARDLASVRNSPIKPNRIIRMGRVSDANSDDLKLLFDDLGLKTLVDLRSPTELKTDPTLMREEVFEDFATMVWMERGRAKDGSLWELPKDVTPVKSRRRKKKWSKVKKGVPDDVEDDDDDDDDEDEEVIVFREAGSDEPALISAAEIADIYTGQRKERHFVSLMNEFKYVKGTVSKLRKRDLTKALLKSPGALLSKRVRSSLKKPFLDEINDGGLPMLNELLLRFGAPGIKYVLELCADRKRHPIAFYCTAGKDRTGMIAAIILALCGVKAEDIVEDYALSANVYAEMNDHQAMVGALSQRNLDPKTFLGAPPHVMRQTLQSIAADYGSVEGYCDYIGFGPEKRKQLLDACLK